jgi:hypothetical protein
VGEAFKVDARRGAAPLRGEVTRGGSAERAVAPRAIEFAGGEGAPDTEDGRLF